MTAAGPKNLKIVAFNLFGPNHGDALGGIYKWSIRGPKIAATLKSLSPDVLGTQECNGAPAVNTISAALPDHVHINDKIGDNDVWIRRSLTQVKPARFVDLRGDGHKHAVVISLADRTIVNVHMPSGAVPEKVKAAKNLVKLLNAITGPLVVIGDMNSATLSKGYPHQIVADGAGIKWMKSKPTDPNSFAGIGTTRPKQGKWLDAIGVRGIPIKSGGIYPTGPGISDHYPLTATI